MVLLKTWIYAKLFLFGYSNDKQVTNMRIRSEIDYLNFARVGGFHIRINFHARFGY